MKISLEVQLFSVSAPMVLEAGDKVMVLNGIILGLAPDDDIQDGPARAVRKKSGIDYRTMPPKADEVYDIVRDQVSITARRIGDKLGYAPPDRNNRGIISRILVQLVQDGRVGTDSSISKARPFYYVSSDTPE